MLSVSSLSSNKKIVISSVGKEQKQQQYNTEIESWIYDIIISFLISFIASLISVKKIEAKIIKQMFFVKCLHIKFMLLVIIKNFVNWIWPTIVEMENEFSSAKRIEISISWTIPRPNHNFMVILSKSILKVRAFHFFFFICHFHLLIFLYVLIFHSIKVIIVKAHAL